MVTWITLTARKKPIFSLLLVLVSLMSICDICDSVVMPSEEIYPDEDPNYGFSYTFQHCLRKEGGQSFGNLIPCFNKGALAGLVNVDERDSVEITNGVTLMKDMNGKTHKTILSPDIDPTDYRNILEATAELVGKRSLRWDMRAIYPGLFMKIGPTISGAGVLEFVMDQGYATYNDRTIGTGQLIVRQILLPLLLGFKLKLITLVPLLIGVLVIVSKKALLLSKVAVFVTTVLGLNSLLFLQQPPLPLQNTFGDSFPHLDSHSLAYHNKDRHQSYDGHSDDFRETVYRERDRMGDVMESKGRRNFLWEKSGNTAQLYNYSK